MGRPKGAKNKLKQTVLEQHRDQIRQSCICSFEKYIETVQPMRLLGNIHRETISWWTRQDAKDHQLTLLPRDHMKSALMGLRAAWEVVKNPAIRILYISSTSNLA